MRPPQVLLAEDSRVNQVIAMNFLQAAGCEIDLAENGLDAIRKAARRLFDIILMDIQMPKVDGLEAASTIHEEERNAKVPIIAVTANAVESERKKYLEAGMQDCLFKPYREKDMRNILAKHLPQLLSSKETVSPIKKAPEKTEKAEPCSAEVPICDSATAIDRLNGDTSLYKRTVSILFEEWPVLYSEFERSSREGDFELAERMAHSIKGAAAYVGGERLSLVARNAEGAAKKKDQKSLEDFIELFPSEFMLLKDALAPYSS